MDLIVSNVDYLWTGETLLTHRDVHVADGLVTAVVPTRTGADSPTGDDASGGASDGTNERDPVRTLDGRGMALIPGFKNGHTHAAMTLLRGYGDDMELKRWLETRIWPVEAALTPEDIYWGTRLAALEMIKSGTTFANDMYFHPAEAIRAFQDSGIKAAVGLALFDFFDSDRRAEEISRMGDTLRNLGTGHERAAPVSITMAPHSIYTCSGDLLRWARDAAAEAGLVLHTHLAETRTEVDNAKRDFGKRPFAYADDLGLLGPATIAAHAVWMDASEVQTVAARRTTVVHNPASNMKLSSGAFPYRAFAAAGAPMMLAPDGVASNNNLDMFDEMKLASLLQKHHTGDPECLTAEEVFCMATGALIDHAPGSGHSRLFPAISGRIEAGAPADFALIDLDAPQMVPAHNVVSNLVYAANGSVVKTVVCGRRVLMEGGVLPGSEETIREARRCAAALIQRTVDG